MGKTIMLMMKFKYVAYPIEPDFKLLSFIADYPILSDEVRILQSPSCLCSSIFLIGTIQTIHSDRTQNNSQYNHNQSFKRLMAKIKIIKTIVYFFVYKTLITFRQHPHHFIQLFID